MNEWHVFTRGRKEYTGSSLTLEYSGFVCLQHFGRRKIMEDKWFGLKTKVTYKDFKVVDCMIPLVDVKRIERWDIAQEQKETNE